MQDPSQGVARELLPHVHLLSTSRWPVLQSIHPDKVTEILLSAPKIARDSAPFYWTYLDRPADGTILLTWQPLEAMGSQFASDGYIWAGAELAFQVEVSGGYLLEMYHHKVGYAPGEPVATHARRRYRLVPPRVPNPSLPPPDTSLWIVHYAPADPQERVPSNVIPMTLQIQQMMQTRSYLQTQGQIMQKEFMLHDRANWPQVPFPRGPPRQQQQYPAGMVAPRAPPAMSYPAHQMVAGAAGPPAKRARTQAVPPGAQAASLMTMPEGTIEDEEDTARGDLFDHITPREISASRYRQNHEWMEEIFSSPYAAHQLTPVDLGLGLKGELSALTDGILDAPSGALTKDSKDGYSGRLDPAQAEEFRKRVNDRVMVTAGDIEKMKAKHAKRLAKFKANSIVSVGEKDLRDALFDPANTGTEFWRLEGRVEEIEDGEGDAPIQPKVHKKVDDIVAQVEASLGRHMSAVQELRRIQDGGLEERQPSPPAAVERTGSGSIIGDLDLGNSATGLLDQFHTGLSSTSNTPQTNLNVPSGTGTPAHNTASPQPGLTATSSTAPTAAASTGQTGSKDVEMGEAGDVQAGTGDWVVVPPGGVSPEGTMGGQASGAPSAPAAPSGTTGVDLGADPSASNTPGAFGADFDVGESLDDLDTAGDALASFGAGGDDSGDVGDGDLDLGMDLGLDDSAFGDAFHGVEHNAGADEGTDGL